MVVALLQFSALTNSILLEGAIRNHCRKSKILSATLGCYGDKSWRGETAVNRLNV